jgi:hydrogenase maturation factor
MTVMSLDEEQGLARCRDEEGNDVDVEVALVEPVATGDEVLVHAGVALTLLGEGAR